ATVADSRATSAVRNPFHVDLCSNGNRSSIVHDYLAPHRRGDRQGRADLSDANIDRLYLAIGRPAAVERDARRIIRIDRAASGRRRNFWRDELLGDAAHSGDRNSTGARRATLRRGTPQRL